MILFIMDSPAHYFLDQCIHVGSTKFHVLLRLTDSHIIIYSIYNDLKQRPRNG